MIMPCQLFILKILLTWISKGISRVGVLDVTGTVDNVDCAVLFMLVTIVGSSWQKENNHYWQFPALYSSFMENW